MAAGIPLGPYTLVRRLAKGGMAEIFLARKEGPEGFARDLVVKRILPHLSEDAEFIAMFRDEARVVARISHPNVVQVYDFGAVEGTSYLVMELVRGVDLRALTTRALERSWAERRPGAIPPHHAAKILSFVCEGLSSAHSLTDPQGRPLGLVHRDVTPSNVLVSFDGAVKVADFGIAKLQTGRRRDATEVGKVRGKYAYLSPEQARGEALDGRSDLFNVGILLYETITGDTLFPHQDPVAARACAAGGVIPKRERLRSLPPPLREVAEKALAPRRGDRYPDALSMRADLERYVRSCAEPSDTVELGRFVRRLFGDVLEEEARRGPRAAGTVPLTTGQPLPAPPQHDRDDPTPAFGATETLPTEVDAPPVAVVAPKRAFPLRPWMAMLALGAFLVGVVGVALLRGDDAAPEVPAMPDRPPTQIAIPQPPPSPAVLRLSTDPAGLAIRVDGEERGVAPLQLRLAAGVHRVEALRDGEVVQRVDVPLGEGEAHELRLEAPVRSGTLRVVSQPEHAWVLVDAERVGRTPLEVEVAPGEHALGIELEGFETHAETASVAAGSTASFSVILRAAPAAPVAMTMMRARGTGRLAIATTPWCEVFLGRRRLGTTPLTNVSLPTGRHTLTLRSPNRPARRHRVTIRTGETTRVRLAL